MPGPVLGVLVIIFYLILVTTQDRLWFHYYLHIIEQGTKAQKAEVA